MNSSVKRDTDNFIFVCVGMKFHSHPLSMQEIKDRMHEIRDIKLVAEDNIFDKNAVAIFIEGKMFGHVAANYAPIVRKWLENYDYQINIIDIFGAYIKMKFLITSKEAECLKSNELGADDDDFETKDFSHL